MNSMSAMRVLMFGWEFPPYNQGGLGTACEGLVKGLTTQGTDVTLVLPRHQECVIPGCRIISPQFKKIMVSSLLHGYATSEAYDAMWADKGKPSLYGRNLFAEVHRYAAAAQDVVAEEDFDVIHAHDWLTYKAGLAAKKMSGKPLVVHVHATEFDRTGDGAVNQYVYEIEREGMQGADKVITVSEFTKRKVMEQYGVPAAKIEVVHNAVAFNSHDFRDAIALQKQAPLVLFLGRLTLQKGPDYFIQAAKKVLEYAPHVSFAIAGSGDMQGRLMNQVAAWDLSDKISFTGFLRGAAVDRMYQMADLYVMPSVSEPFGITPLEAMRNDVPVLISHQSGVSEVVNHALKINFWDVNDMAAKILAVLEHDVLHSELKRNGKREVYTFNWNEPARKCMSVYWDVMAGYT